ncbi:cytochrome C [Rhodoferax sp. UBA5149]|uniref:cytochrome C n=1 Tax=Rhodoferax sp. UBA5149 TaxID=1947379 RepID=UPI0025D93233|nr:cytochrome C [Rhodoferax sp. UBA5149]
MSLLAKRFQRRLLGLAKLAMGLVAMFTIFLPQEAQAVPAFARQTGQNCVACHAGGQFPELTPYGRMFKMTGYTIGERTIPLSVMGVASYANVADTSKSANPATDFYKNKTPIFATGSLFFAGKITDNIGGFAQITYDNYASDNGDGSFSGHSNADNIDLRYANRVVDGKKEWVYGVSLNNNPSISDPWNTAAAWMQYVPVPSPSSHQFIDGNAPYPGFGSGGNIAGITAYTYWNKTIYAEAGAYRTADNAFRLMSTGIDDSAITRLSGTNPYWRLAYTREWGPHNLMIGTSGMVAHVYDGGTDPSDPANLGQFRNTGIDAQYQYLLDPHTVTAQLAYMQQEQTYSDNAGGASGLTDTNNVLRAKVSYVYQAKYGGSLAYFNLTGTTNIQSDPATRGITYEAFWTPKQNIRIGAQYTAYGKFQGATDNYDGAGRNASDNNSLFLYAWFAY